MILDVLRRLSAAEEFFVELDVAFEPAVLDVSRLHILKRFTEYLGREDTETGDDEAHRGLCRSALERAYRDFADPAGPRRKTFKVFRQAQPASAFVPLAALKR